MSTTETVSTADRIQAATAEIHAERRRQIDGEGWTAEHDDQHSTGELLRAAVFYYQHAARPDMPLKIEANGAPMGWPWEPEWWKPKDKHRDLVRAGALCLAERDRLRRQGRQNVGHVAVKLKMIVGALADVHG